MGLISKTDLKTPLCPYPLSRNLLSEWLWSLVALSMFPRGCATPQKERAPQEKALAPRRERPAVSCNNILLVHHITNERFVLQIPCSPRNNLLHHRVDLVLLQSLAQICQQMSQLPRRNHSLSVFVEHSEGLD